jgi:hypothetical protein
MRILQEYKAAADTRTIHVNLPSLTENPTWTAANGVFLRSDAHVPKRTLRFGARKPPFSHAPDEFGVGS